MLLKDKRRAKRRRDHLVRDLHSEKYRQHKKESRVKYGRHNRKERRIKREDIDPDTDLS